MVEGIVVGVAIALVWVAALLPLMSPWAHDHVNDSVLGTAVSLVGAVAAFVAFDRASDLAEIHGNWIGYGSVLGVAAAVLVACGVILRRTSFFRAWQLYGIPVGRVPPPKSRRAGKSRRAPRSQRA